MPEEFVCQECGCAQEVVSFGEDCPYCGGKFVNLNDDLMSMDDEVEESDDNFDVDGGFSTI